MEFCVFELQNQHLLAIVLKLPLYACDASLAMAASQNIAVQVFSCFAYALDNNMHAIHRGHISWLDFFVFGLFQLRRQATLPIVHVVSL